MSRPNKQKICTSPVQGGLNKAFAHALGALDHVALPPAPEPPATLKTPARRGRAVLRRETSGRGGKAVIVIGGFDPAIPDAELASLAARLRKACGCGGTLRGREIEIQGEMAARLHTLLAAEGYRTAGEKS